MICVINMFLFRFHFLRHGDKLIQLAEQPSSQLDQFESQCGRSLAPFNKTAKKKVRNLDAVRKEVGDDWRVNEYLIRPVNSSGTEKERKKRNDKQLKEGSLGTLLPPDRR